MRLRDYCKKTQKWLACYRHLRWDVATPVGNAQGRRKEVARSFSLVLSFRSCAGITLHLGASHSTLSSVELQRSCIRQLCALSRSARLWAPPKDFAQP